MLHIAQAVFRRRLTRSIALPIVLLLLLSGVFIWQITRLLSVMRWVEHTDRVISQANVTQKLLLDLETGVRGYMLSGEPEFLEPYQQADAVIDPAFNKLSSLVSDNPPQVERLTQLKVHYQDWDRYVPELVTLRQQGESEPISILRARKQLMDTIRQGVAEFIAVEEQLRDRRNRTVQQTTRVVITSSIMLAIGAGSVLAYFTRRDLFQVAKTYEDALKTAQEQTEASQRAAQRLITLHSIDRAILSAQSTADLAQEALLRLTGVTPTDQAAVILFNLETNQAQILAGRIAEDATGDVFPITDRIPLDLLQQREPMLLYIEDLALMGDRPPALEKQVAEGDRSFLSVAMQVEGQLIGALNLSASRPHAFNPEDQQVAYEIAAQLAIAIQQSRLRDQLQNYAAQLEQRVAERTVQLQESNEELTAFTYSISHDLRAPLRTMQGFAQALQEDYADELDSAAQDYIRYISEGAQQMDTLITDLLAYSRLSRAQVSLQPVDLNSVVQEALRQLSAQLQERQAEIKIDAPLPHVMAHRPTLIQVVTNLLGNAIKFVEPNMQPEVHIYAQSVQECVRLWVMDNGIGIAPEHQERIFRVFERLHGAEIYPGTGIGLAIVRKGLERMAGRAGVESQLAQGSQFWIELPIVKA